MSPAKDLKQTSAQPGFDRIQALMHAADQGHRLNQDNACKVIKHHFDRLESSLSLKNASVDIGKVQALLIDISHFLQSDNHQILDEGYTQLLNRLIRIYTLGMVEDENLAFAATAANYAKLIEVISQAHPSYDYSMAIGHLLHYMNQLFKQQEGDWLLIFEHLISMPDSIQFMQSLKEHHFKEIQQWIEEGVNNLHQLRDDQVMLHAANISNLADLEQELVRKHEDLETSIREKVVPISLAEDKSALQALLDQREQLIHDLDVKQNLIDLLDENMQEFEEKLMATRRACLVHLIKN